jgi:hypothetical protein
MFGLAMPRHAKYLEVMEVISSCCGKCAALQKASVYVSTALSLPAFQF